MAFRNVSASLTLDTSGYRRALSEAASDTRRLIDQLQGISRVAGMDNVTADVHQLDRALGEVPDTARVAGTTAAGAFDGFEAELEQLDDRARAVAREQKQIGDAAAEASRRAGGAYRTIGTEASQAAASARSSMGGLSTATTGVVVSAERAAIAEGSIGVAATRSATQARGALVGLAGSHDALQHEARQAMTAEMGIGTAAVRAAELARASAVQAAQSLNLITAAAERAAAAETMIGTAAQRSAAVAAGAARTRAGAGGGPGPAGPGLGGTAIETGALAGALSLGRTVAGLAGGLAAFQGFHMIARGAREAISGASDLNESLNKTKFTFGSFTPVVVETANELRESFGQSRSTILDAAASFGLMGKAANLSEADAAGMSTRLVQLAVDAQSFMNVPLDEVLVRFQSGLAGETEAVRRWGIDLSEATVKTHAYSMGIARLGEELTMAQKVQARYDLIINSPAMKAATGDMERTADQFANRMRIIGGRLREWAVDVGTAAIPHILKLADVLEDVGRRTGPGFAAAFEKIGAAVSEAFQRLQPFFANMAEIGQNLWRILQQITEAIGPFVAALGGIAAVGVISALNGLSAALSSITGFLADNETLVKTLALAYGASLVPRLAQAAAGMLTFSRATAAATATSGGGGLARLAGSLISLGPAASNAVRGLDSVGAATTRAASTSAAGWTSTHRALGLVNTATASATIGLTETGRGGFRAGQQIATGMQRAADSIGRVRIGALGIGVALATGVMAIKQGWERQSQGASSWAEKQFGKAPQTSVKQMLASINELGVEYNRLVDRTTKGRDNIGQSIIQAPFRAFGKEIMTPGLKEDADRRDALLRQRNEEVAALRRYESVLNEVSTRTGMTRAETEKFAASQYDLGQSTKENSNKIVESWESTQQAAHNAGVSTEDFATAAARAGISLAEGGEDAQKQISAAIAELDKLGNAAGVSGAAVLKMFNMDTEAAKGFLAAVVDVSDKVKSAFMTDMDVTTHVNADPKAISDAQQQVADLQSQGKPIPLELKLETEGPLEQLKKFYTQAIAKGGEFSANYQKAIALGFDPDLIQRLVLQGPEKAGPLLAALVSQQGQGLIGLVNTSETELRRQGEVMREVTTQMLVDQTVTQALTTQAVQSGSRARTDTLRDAITVQRAMVLLGEGATMDMVIAQTGLKTGQVQAVIDAWGFKLFAAIDSMLGKFQAGSTRGLGGAGQFKAQGAVDLGNGRVGTVQGDRRNAHQPEIVRGGAWRVFAEDETQGESYIPHAMDRRPRAQGLLAQTARIIGMVAMPVQEFKARLDRDTVRLADGAVVSRHEWAGSVGAPSRPALDRLRERFVFAFGGVEGRHELVPQRSVFGRPVVDREILRSGRLGDDLTVLHRDERSLVRDHDAVGGHGGPAHGLLRFAVGGIAKRDRALDLPAREDVQVHVAAQRQHGREPFEARAGQQRVGEHVVRRARGAVALETLLDPVRAVGDGVVPAAHRAEAGLVAPQGYQPGSTFLRLGHGLLRFAGGGVVLGQPHRGVVRGDRVEALSATRPASRSAGARRATRPAVVDGLAGIAHPVLKEVARTGTAGQRGAHDPTVRRFAQGGIAESLPQVPLKELAPYNLSPQGGGKRALDATTVMRASAVQNITRREQDINKLRLAVAMQAGGKAGTIGGGKIDQGWSNITHYLATKGVNFIVTSTTGGNHVPGSYHYRGKAVDLVGTARSSMSQIFDTLAMVGGTLAELFYDPKGWFIKNGAPVKGAIGGHSDHVHAATFRLGGVVQPGSRQTLRGLTVPYPSYGGGAQPLSLPRQRPFEKERIRRGRDQLEHGPMGLPRREPVRSKIVASLRDVLVPKGKALASGGVAARRANFVDSPYQLPGATRAGDRGGAPTRSVPGMAQQWQLFDSLGVQGGTARRADAGLKRDERFRPGPSLYLVDGEQSFPGLPGGHSVSVRRERSASGDVPSLRPGVSPQRERPARPIRQRRDVRDHPHLRLAPFQGDLKQVSHFEVGGMFDRRDRPGGHGSTLRRARQSDDDRRQPFGVPGQLNRHLVGMHRDHRSEGHVPAQVPHRRVAISVADLNEHVPQVMRDAVESPRAKREVLLDRYQIGGVHGSTLRREGLVARGAQPDIRFARGGVTAPASIRAQVEHVPVRGADMGRRETSLHVSHRYFPEQVMGSLGAGHAFAQGLASPSKHVPTVDPRVMRLGSFEALRLPSFAKGGTVPGTPGEPRVIIAHAGEEVQPPTIRLGGASATGGNTVTVNIDAPMNLQGARFADGLTMDDLQRERERWKDQVLGEIEEQLSSVG